MRVHTILGIANLLTFGGLIGILASASLPSVIDDFSQPPGLAQPTDGDSSTGSRVRNANDPNSDSPPPDAFTGDPTENGQSSNPPPDAGPPLGQRFPIQFNPSIDMRRDWLWWVSTALAVLIVVIWWLRRQLEPAYRVIEDSGGYEKSLRQWFPLIYAANPTPRAIKRFDNRARFLAMRLRKSEKDPDWIDSLVDVGSWLTARLWPNRTARRERNTEEAPAETLLSDEMLVALSAVELFERKPLRSEDMDEIRTHIVAELNLAEEEAAQQGTKDHLEQLTNLKNPVAAAGAWDPKQMELNAYRELCGEIRA